MERAGGVEKRKVLCFCDVDMGRKKLNIIHKCEFCGKVFPRSYNLNVHRRIHTGDKPYVCQKESCTRSFAWKSSLDSHLLSHRRVGGVLNGAEGEEEEEEKEVVTKGATTNTPKPTTTLPTTTSPTTKQPSGDTGSAVTDVDGPEQKKLKLTKKDTPQLPPVEIDSFPASRMTSIADLCRQASEDDEVVVAETGGQGGAVRAPGEDMKVSYISPISLLSAANENNTEELGDDNFGELQPDIARQKGQSQVEIVKDTWNILNNYTPEPPRVYSPQRLVYSEEKPTGIP